MFMITEVSCTDVVFKQIIIQISKKDDSSGKSHEEVHLVLKAHFEVLHD